jgi:hypothetical protein
VRRCAVGGLGDHDVGHECLAVLGHHVANDGGIAEGSSRSSGGNPRTPSSTRRTRRCCSEGVVAQLLQPRADRARELGVLSVEPVRQRALKGGLEFASRRAGSSRVMNIGATGVYWPGAMP